jgi:hypothetical protein
VSTSTPPRNGPDQAGDPGQPGPQSDRLRPVLRPERRLDQREAARRQQGPAHALQDPRGDQLSGVLRQPAEQRGRGEPADPDEEDAAPPVPVAEGAAQQDQRRQRQRVAGDRPLETGQRGVQLAADRGEGDLHGGGVDERHT